MSSEVDLTAPIFKYYHIVYANHSVIAIAGVPQSFGVMGYG